MDNRDTSDSRLTMAPFRLADWRVDPASKRISRGSETIKLQPKAMAVLVFLAQKPGDVVTREALENAVWSGTVVGYDALSNTIIKLRKAFGDQASQPRIIETISKTGYRLIAEVSTAAAGSEQVALAETPAVRMKSAWLAGGIAVLVLIASGVFVWLQPREPDVERASVEKMTYPLPDKPSIAVLPFANMSGDPEQEYFADGMTEDLITDLSRISGLFVIARNTSFSYRGQHVEIRRVAEELGVRYVLEGSVRRVGEQVRINAQLIDATTGGHLWAERYDGSLTDIFALQDTVTSKIADAMSVTLTSEERKELGSLGTSSVTAHDAYLRGLSFYVRNTPADNANAEAHFKRAVELDPDFKHAYTALAKVYNKGGPEYARAMQMNFAEAVILVYTNLAKSAGANIADAHVVLSRLALIKHQVGVALREAERAMKLDANGVEGLKAQARALIYAGQYFQGRKRAERIIRRDPAFPAEPLYLIGLSHFAAGSYNKAAVYVEQAIESDPTTSVYAGLLAAVYGKLDMKEKANQAWQTYWNTWHYTPWIAAAVYRYPFQDRNVLKHLADGFEAAGATENLAHRPTTLPNPRYLKLDRETRLAGQEIKSLLFGQTIKGVEFQNWHPWEQTRTIDGKLSYSHSYSADAIEGESWIEDNRLCERWRDKLGDIAICSQIFRDQHRGENNYYMVTDFGPTRFWVMH